MNYFVRRDGQEYGPYLLADLQRYVASGNILLTDLARSEGMDEWMPLSGVIGSIPVPISPAAQGYQPLGSPYPMPPGLHWALVLLFAVVTCGLFTWAWAFVLSAYVRKLVPRNKALVWFIIGFLVSFGAGIISSLTENRPDVQAVTSLLQLGGMVLVVVGNFSLKNALEEHFNSAENVGLSLSGVMTFFFGVFYFQYHLGRIREARERQGLDSYGA